MLKENENLGPGAESEKMSLVESLTDEQALEILKQTYDEVKDRYHLVRREKIEKSIENFLKDQEEARLWLKNYYELGEALEDQTKITETLNHHGVEFSKAECQHWFQAIDAVAPMYLTALDVANGHRFSDVHIGVGQTYGEKAYIIPSESPNPRNVFIHEVLHLASTFLSENREIDRVGISKRGGVEIFDWLSEWVTEYVTREIINDSDRRSYEGSIEFFQIMKPVVDENDLIQAHFSEDGLTALKDKLDVKLGPNAFNILEAITRASISRNRLEMIEQFVSGKTVILYIKLTGFQESELENPHVILRSDFSN